MKSRAGLTLVELMVAATLIVSGLTMIGKLTVTSGRMWQQTRQEQVALEELSNQLERLLALPPDQRDEAISELAPSAFAAERLQEATITARTFADSAGQRLELQINWNRHTPAKPLMLVGWIDAVDSESAGSQESSL